MDKVIQIFLFSGSIETLDKKKNLAIFLGQKLDYHKKFSNIWQIQLPASINPTVVIGSQTYQNVDTMTGLAPH